VLPGAILLQEPDLGVLVDLVGGKILVEQFLNLTDFISEIPEGALGKGRSGMGWGLGEGGGGGSRLPI
jgi:hypothetical protein